MAIKQIFNVPAQKMREYVNAKRTVLPSETWQMVDFDAHSHAFALAGAVKLEFLHDVLKSIRDNANRGEGFGTWKKEFRRAVIAHGGDSAINTTPSGTLTTTQDGNLHIPLLNKWRQRVIYETNMKSAYAAGKYAELTDPDNLENFPFWQYVHGYLRTPQSPRDEHVKWNGMILPANDPWWNTHFPPNGWGCTCGIIALTKKQAQEAGGVSSQIPEGDADKGWVGNPGKREGGVNAVFESAQRFEKNEPQLHRKFLSEYVKNISEYNVKNEYAKGIEDVSQRVLGMWNEKHYENKSTRNGDKSAALPVVLLSEQRRREINDVFVKGLAKLKETDAKNRNRINVRDFTKSRVITITEERFAHAVRVEKGHDTPPKDAYKKLSEILKNGKIKFSPIYRNGNEGVVVLESETGIAVNGLGEIVTFYGKK